MIKEDLERINKRGPADLEERIEMLTKQVKFMQGKCREAGRAILDLDLTNKGLTKEIDRLSEENFNLSLVRGKDNGKR